MRRNSVIKNMKIEQAKGWINKLTCCGYCMNKLKPYNGDELDKMTLKEIQMLLNFITSTYHFAFQAGVDLMREKSA